MADPTRLPRAPQGLSGRSQSLWRATNRDYVLAQHELALLAEALKSLDRAEQARGMVDVEGITVLGRSGPRAHPAVAVERDARTLAARLFRELSLDPAALDPRPPRVPTRSP